MKGEYITTDQIRAIGKLCRILKCEVPHVANRLEAQQQQWALLQTVRLRRRAKNEHQDVRKKAKPLLD